MKDMTYNKTKGFSLIELMVVISIIGILMAIGAVSYTTAQRKSRDASRKVDMKSMQEAMEQYYTVNSIYPTSAACDELFSSAEFAPGGRPSDPRSTQAYTFACDTTNGAGYCICAELENDTGNSSGPPASGFACNFAGGGDYYCVTNQQ